MIASPLVTPSHIARAIELIAAAERDLGPLTDCQHRALLADRTEWPGDLIRDVVEAVYSTGVLFDHPLDAVEE